MKNRILQVAILAIGSLLIIFLADPRPSSLAVGGVLVAAGEFARLWACGHLSRNNEVTTSGPYAYLRDPLYLGRLLIVVGLIVMAWGKALWVLIPALALFAFSYMPRKYRQEMTRLEELFGEEYRQYAAAVPSLLPRLTRYPGARDRSWDAKLCWKENREQYFLVPVLVVAILILVRDALPVGALF